MRKISLKEALAEVLKDMRAMSPSELRAELRAHSEGSVATALCEAQSFLAENFSFSWFSHYHPVLAQHSLLCSDFTNFSSDRTPENLLESAANDSPFALAA